MRLKLAMKGLLAYIVGLLFCSLLIFIPAGTIEYFNGWLFLGLLFIPMFIMGFVLLIKNPELLERRLNNKEKENTQKVVIFISFLLFLGGFILCGLNFKYKWNILPDIVVYISAAVMFISYMLYMEVMRENTYLSRTVEVEENQKVIDTGLYSIVRHPMYFSVVFLFLSMPLVLGCIYSFFLFLIFPIILIIRILNEEKVLETELKGYKEYKQKVKYRLIPFVW